MRVFYAQDERDVAGPWLALSDDMILSPLANYSRL